MEQGRRGRRPLPFLIASVAVGALALGLAGCGTGPVSSSPTSTSSSPTSTKKSHAPPPPRCVDAQLGFSVTNTGNGGGNVNWVGTLVNQSPHPCDIGEGFPGLRLVGAGQKLLSTAVSDYRTAWGPEVIDLGHGEEASFQFLVSDGAQSLPSLPDCGAAVSVAVTLPGVARGIEAAAPSGLIAYPFSKGGPCGVVYVSALLPGSAQRLRCPSCFPAPVPGKAVTSDTVKTSGRPVVRWVESQ